MNEVISYDAYTLRRPRRKGLHPETELQIRCFVFYDKLCRVDRQLREKTRLYAINPVPGKTVQQAVLSKRMGLRAGIFDAQFLDKRGGTLQQTWIEFKAQDGRYTQDQRDWLNWLQDTPIRCIELRTVDEFREALRLP